MHLPSNAYHADQYRFPSVESAPGDGPLALGGDLSPGRLIAAYRNGIFPWYNPGEPILWWSPDPRFILYPQHFHLPRGLRKALRRRSWEIRSDTAFTQVMQACAEVPRPGQNGTWITDEMLDAYGRLHHSGLAHSIEVWLEGQLVGGLYGVSIGAAFFGESMFHRVTDASKVAIYHLVALASAWKFLFIDCQVHTAHLERLGAKEVPRKQFLKLLETALGQETRIGKWQITDELGAIK